MTLLNLKRIKVEDMTQLWRIGFSEVSPEWKQWDAPFLNDYHPYPNEKSFINSNLAARIMSDSVRGIFFNDQIIGNVTRLWQDKEWQIGIVIYNPELRNQGLGQLALSMWIEAIYLDYPNLKHLSLITWSGNISMIKTAESLGFQLVEKMPSLYHFQGKEYDQLKYQKDFN